MMDSKWLDFLAGRGARQRAGQINDFGDAKDELHAAACGTVLAPLTHFSLIRATGEDAATFLHNLLSNDILHLGRERAVRCGFCSPKGRLLADFLVWRKEADYYLQLSADIQPALLKKLGMYILRSKVRLQDVGADFVLLGLAGDQMAAALNAIGQEPPPSALDVVHFAEGTIVRLDASRCQLAVRADAAPALWSKLSTQARAVGVPAWRWLEIAAGIPHITAATQEEFVPQMANLELIGGVSFTKGCYPGQEVVARTRYLGKVKRRTYRARIDSDCPAPGTDVFSPDLPAQSCGKIIEAAPSPAGGCELLVSMLMSSAEGGEVHVGRADGPRLEFLSLPYALE